MEQNNVLQIQQMIAGLDSERMADLLMQHYPELDPNEFEQSEQQPQAADAFTSAIAAPESGLQQPQQQLPAPRLFGFGNPANPQVVPQVTGAPQMQFPQLFGG